MALITMVSSQVPKEGVQLAIAPENLKIGHPVIPKGIWFPLIDFSGVMVFLQFQDLLWLMDWTKQGGIRP